MGDPTPDVIELQCGSCNASFRLRPTKGRLPKGPVNCPECDAEIEVPKKSTVPQAAVMRRQSSTGATLDESTDSSVDEIEALAESLKGVDLQATGTLMGAPIAIGFDREKTVVAEIATEGDQTEVSGPGTKSPDPLALERSRLNETSESIFNNSTRQPWEEPRATPDPPSKPPEQLTSQDQQGKNSKLSDLLKKVREKRGSDTTARIPLPQPKSSNLFGKFDGPDKRPEPPESSTTTQPLGRILPTKVVRKKANPNQKDVFKAAVESQAGMAGERRGSGYIRLPTAEILDVLGSGTYRLMVENVVYEPVDEQGLVGLIKAGVLMGAELIADEDGDWMPVDQHPVFQKLKKKMAAEAHILLKQVTTASAANPTLELHVSTLDAIQSEVSESPPPLPSADSDDTVETEQPALPDSDGFSAPSVPDGAVPAVDDIADALQADEPELPDFPDPPVPHGLIHTSAVDDVADALDTTTSEFPEIPEFSDPSVPGGLVHTSAVDDVADFLDQNPLAAEDSENFQLLDDSEPDPPVHIIDDPPAQPEFDLNHQLDVQAQIVVPPKKSKAGLVVFLLLLVLIAAGAAAFYSGVLDPFLGADNTAALKTPDEPEVEPEKKPEKPESVVKKPATLEAARSAHDDAPSVATATALADFLIANKNSEEALDVLENALALEGGSGLQTKLDELQASLKKVDVVPEEPADSLEELKADMVEAATLASVRKHPVLQVTINSKSYRWYPETQASLQPYRSILALKTLCTLMDCGFGLPTVTKTQITKSEWETLTQKFDVKGLRKLVWTKLEGQDEAILLGALQEEIVGAGIPMDKSIAWRKVIDNPEAPLTESLKGLKDEASIITAEIKNSKGRDMARALSSILVVDYLTNNFARIEPAKEPFGFGTLAKDGQIYSVDNVEMFQTRASTRVKGRVKWASRFSKPTIEALRELKPEEINVLIFPNPSRSEKTALRVFWKQHKTLLEGVDSRLAAGDETKVFF